MAQYPEAPQALSAEAAHEVTLDGVCLAAIGPVTANAMKRLGLAVDVMPAIYTLPSLIAALEDYFLV